MMNSEKKRTARCNTSTSKKNSTVWLIWLSLRKSLPILVLICLFTNIFTFAQQKQFTQQEINLIKESCDSVSGAGKPVIGDGSGGWRTGSDGIQYRGSYPADPRWKTMSADKTSGSVIKQVLLPAIKPILELHLRDAVVCLGGDDNYYICLSMPSSGISILKSSTGKPEGPYVHATSVTEKPFVNGIDPTLFQDDDGKVYFTWGGANRIALMKMTS